MFLKKEDLQKLSQISKEAALAAGEIITAAQGEEVKVSKKRGGENIASCVVTQIDLRAQKVILDKLHPTLKEFDLGMLTEESLDDHSRLNKDYFWCIDPLDGTLAFSRNEDGYSISIALISQEGESIIGVVYNPRSKDLYQATKGLGALKNGFPFRLENKNEFLTLLYDQSFLKLKSYEIELKTLRENARSIGLSDVKLHHLGGAVMNGISTIELAPAIYYKHPKTANGGGSIWDFAASSLIQSEAGGYNSNYYHKPLKLNNVETTFMNREGIIYASSEKISRLQNSKKTSL